MIRELASDGAYAGVNGVHVYYEAYGRGDPLLLLHGGFGGGHVFGGQIPRARAAGAGAASGPLRDRNGAVSKQG